MRAASKRNIKKHPFFNSASVDRVEHCYNIVSSHLRKVGTYNKTIKKFPPRAIYAAVKHYLERSPSEPLDIAVEFEQLRDFSTVDEFLESLQEQHTLAKDIDKQGYFYALDEVEEKAAILGLKLLEKNEVAVNKNEYYFLLRCQKQFESLKRDSQGWPLSLL